MEHYVNTVLRPLLRGDGGELVFQSFDGETVSVVLRGECARCPIAERCLRWLEEKTLADRGERVRFAATMKKPYFFDR